MQENNYSEPRNDLSAKDFYKEFEKNINQIKYENNEIREAFLRLKENYMLVKKKVLITKMKINEVVFDLQIE